MDIQERTCRKERFSSAFHNHEVHVFRFSSSVKVNGSALGEPRGKGDVLSVVEEIDCHEQRHQLNPMF
jgi:hypothetical protein